MFSCLAELSPPSPSISSCQGSPETAAKWHLHLVQLNFECLFFLEFENFNTQCLYKCGISGAQAPWMPVLAKAAF